MTSLPRPVALVTGASSGIGLAASRLLAHRGYAVTMVARRADKLLAAARDHVRPLGVPVLTLPANLGSREETGLVLDRHRAEFGRLDVLVNCAGVAVAAPLTEHGDKQIALLTQVNLGATMILVRDAVPLLLTAARQRGRALVVNVASVAGTRPGGHPGTSVYAATKAGVVGFTAAMNSELGPQGVVFSALCPGWVATDMTEDVGVPREQMIDAADVAGAIGWLLDLGPQCMVPTLELLRPGGVL